VDKQVPIDGRVRVNVALQVAGIATQVTAALRSDNLEKREDLERRLALAQSQLDPLDSPPGLVPFIDVMRGLLRGDDVAARAGGLPLTYRAVYEQVVASVMPPEPEGELTVRQVVDEVVHDVLNVSRFGTFDQRQQLIDVLLKMQQEAAERPHLAQLAAFCEAARLLLDGEDPEPVAAHLSGFFRARWKHIVNTLDESTDA